MRPGAEKPEMKHQRKHIEDDEEESPKPKEKVRTELETGAGPSRGSKLLEGGLVGLDPDFRRLFKGLLGCLNCQNQLLAQLVELKMADVYRGKESKLEEEFEEGREEEVAAEILDLTLEGAGLAEVKGLGGVGGRAGR